jgi:hypothetical protein
MKTIREGTVGEGWAHLGQRIACLSKDERWERRNVHRSLGHWASVRIDLDEHGLTVLCAQLRKHRRDLLARPTPGRQQRRMRRSTCAVQGRRSGQRRCT